MKNNILKVASSVDGRINIISSELPAALLLIKPLLQ